MCSADAERQRLIQIGGVATEHDQPVQAERRPRAGRHSGLQCGQEVIIQRVNGFAFCSPCRGAGVKAPALFREVRQFRKCIDDFQTANVKLPTFSNRRVIGAAARQRRRLNGIIQQHSRSVWRQGGFH